ncbi:unnamed protein product, partial [Aureobasidium pullulans]
MPSKFLTPKIGPNYPTSMRGDGYKIVSHSEVVKLRLLERRDSQRGTPAAESKSPEPPRSFRDIEDLLNHIDQTKIRLQEYLSKTTKVVPEAPAVDINIWDPCLIQSLDENDLDELFKGLDQMPTPDIKSPDPIGISTDYFGDMAMTNNSAGQKTPMFGPLMTPPVSVSSRPSSRSDSGLQQRNDAYNMNGASDVFSLNNNDHGNTALHIAARDRHHSIIRLLVETGTDINSSNNLQMTALQIAITSANITTAQYLLGLGADVSGRTSSGDTSLHLAARIGDVSLVESLLQRSVGLNAKNHCGETALHAAVSAGHEDVVRLMSASGVDSQVKVGVAAPMDDGFDWSSIMEV